jgi:DGQHR domain-containing protein
MTQTGANEGDTIQRLSVIVPKNPFAPETLQEGKHCLCALDVIKLMEWWPGMPHSPHRDPQKVKAVQRSLEWKRVAHIAAYLLQQEIVDVPDKIDKFFRSIYEPRKNEPGREWPPRINKVIGFERSEFPTFSNVLLHVHGARIEVIEIRKQKAAELIFDEEDSNLNFSVIDGQHRINGAYFAIKLLQETDPSAEWQIPSEIFLDLDPPGEPPRRQAQIFIDVNFYQKKVARSLVADLFPTARGPREAIDRQERTQDIGRKLMLEKGPLVGMIQIPGIKYGVKDVIALATLNGAIEDVLEPLEESTLTSLESQTDFIAQCLNAWFEASGRFERPGKAKSASLDPENVTYQGRVLVAILTLVPAMIWVLQRKDIQLISEEATAALTNWLRDLAEKAHLLEKGIFLPKSKFKQRGYLGSGGIGRFRDVLWAATLGKKRLARMKPPSVSALANKNRQKVLSALNLPDKKRGKA